MFRRFLNKKKVWVGSDMYRDGTLYQLMENFRHYSMHYISSFVEHYSVSKS